MSTKNINLLWKDFKGIRTMNTINSPTQLAADIAHNIRLSKEKSGEMRSIVTSGWFEEFTDLEEPIIRLVSANISGYVDAEQMIAFTRSGNVIKAWLVMGTSGVLEKVQIGSWVGEADITDFCMVQIGDYLALAVAFGSSHLGFIMYSTATPTITGVTWTDFGSWHSGDAIIADTALGANIKEITSIRQYGARLAINGTTEYKSTGKSERIFGVWFSVAGEPTNFSTIYIDQATETSAFCVPTGDKIVHLENYHGLTAFGRNRSYNITGTSQNDYRILDLTAKGVIGNAVFTLNGQCAYVDSQANNIFTLRDNIDGTIGFNDPIGNDIQGYLKDVENVTVNAYDRRVRMTKETGQCLVYDVDIGEWTEETLNANARCVTFNGREYYCDRSKHIYLITDQWGANSQILPDDDGFYSHYRTNLIWLDSQTSVKSHLYPFAVVLEPRTTNIFKIKFTTDRGDVYEATINRAGIVNVATYSNSSAVPADGSHFVNDKSDLSGRVFFSMTDTDLLVTIDRPPFWRYLQIDIYTSAPTHQINVSGIEAKNTFLTDEQLDY